ncbi:PRC-barrel domain-containing protein [Noviherbaspirillum sp.]|uniref:PRC-barrel domain-containing protein n=1 Tax=Noviherbaspirillum sp. TaxID=1926288 RepID=UPI002D57D5DA|nr:PRC-barrel domain-containing protein [Noviherbaspirillum sp.]HZW21561.1 PRC-barrel domain-containing protein [Noviherbaspirillum sp.]
MNMRFPRKLLACGAMAAAGMSALMDSLAQEGGSSGSSPPSSAAAGTSAAPEQGSLDVRASRLLGRSIKDAGGETLGEFKDFMIDVGARRVDYAVLSLGGTLGFGDKLYAYPMSAFKVSGRDEMLLALDRNKLKDAPGFVRDAWPGAGDSRYFDKVDQFFRQGETAPGAADAARATPRRQLVRATELIGKNVDDSEGRNAGEVQDLVMDIGRGRLSYVVLDFDKSWSLDNKLLPVPLSALRFPEKRRADLVLTLDRKQLDMSHGFERNLWPDLNTAEFRNRINGYFMALERSNNAGGANLGTGGGNTGSSAGGR